MTITIRRNENAPQFDQFQYSANISENTARNVVVLRLNATDRDVGVKWRLCFSLWRGIIDILFCVCVKCIHLLLVFHLLMGLITFDWTGQNYLCIRSCHSNSFLPAVLLESNYRIHHSQWWLDHRQPTFIHSKMNHYYSWMIIDIWESWNRNQNKQVQLKGSTDIFFNVFRPRFLLVTTATQKRSHQ